jgi:hypothetical protein
VTTGQVKCWFDQTDAWSNTIISANNIVGRRFDVTSTSNQRSHRKERATQLTRHHQGTPYRVPRPRRIIKYISPIILINNNKFQGTREVSGVASTAWFDRTDTWSNSIDVSYIVPTSIRRRINGHDVASRGGWLTLSPQCTPPRTLGLGTYFLTQRKYFKKCFLGE